jgi:hypothetical protein
MAMSTSKSHSPERQKPRMQHMRGFVVRQGLSIVVQPPTASYPPMALMN